MVRIESDIKLDFSSVLIRPKRSELRSRSDVVLLRSFSYKWARKAPTTECVPIFASNMDTTGTMEMARALSKEHMLTALHKFYTREDWLAFAASDPDVLPFCAVTGGTSDADRQNVVWAANSLPNLGFICLDVANGYSFPLGDTVRKVREAVDGIPIIAGNIVTNEMTEELVLEGADIVKVGIGPGSVCTTRRMTGCGYPQLSAVLECADAAHGLRGMIVSDGGCTVPGDVAKAFGGGADFVMLGGMLAGHDESGGETIEDEMTGAKFKQFYGMSSDTAMNKYAGGVAAYRASEGKTVRVPYRGPVVETLQEILGGLRSCCTYVGARELKELTKRTTFLRVTSQLNTVFGDK